MGVSRRAYSSSGHYFGTACLPCTQIIVRGVKRSPLLLLQRQVGLVGGGGLVFIFNCVCSLG